MERENNKQKEMFQIFLMVFLLFNTSEHAYILTRDHEETHALPVFVGSVYSQAEYNGADSSGTR